MANMANSNRPTICNMTSEFFKDIENNVGIDHEDDHGGLRVEYLEDLDAVDVTDEPDCAVCLKRLQDNDLIALLDCGHYICLECSDDWEVAADRATTCPFCQTDIHTRTVCVAKVFPRGSGSGTDPINVQSQ